MSDSVIRVENLGKRYTLSHQQDGKQYKALRDLVADGTRAIGRRVLCRSSIAASSNQEDFWALKDVNFEIKQGDRVGIIGRNGAGKSTLLKILSRIVEPTTGEIAIRGRVASLLEVGTGFHPELTGRENIYLNGAILGMSRSEIVRKFDEIVDFAEVEKFLDTPVKRYSSGMYVRLAFAVAAHLEPEILIVDEVLAVGDAQFQKKCLGKMEAVGKEGRTVLFVSHNMATVRHLCNTGIFMERGHVALQAPAADCISAYIDEAGERLGCILDHQSVKVPIIKVTDARINRLAKDLIYLPKTDQPIEIMMALEVKEACRISMEITLQDREGNNIAICVPGHVDAEQNIHNATPGCYTIRTLMSLPNLNKGTYRLNIGLTDPGHREYINFLSAVELEVAGFCTNSGGVFEQSLTGSGYQVLNGETSLESVGILTYS
jgi:lipopolysaccharide transport system ATP-binding protein